MYQRERNRERERVCVCVCRERDVAKVPEHSSGAMSVLLRENTRATVREGERERERERERESRGGGTLQKARSIAVVRRLAPTMSQSANLRPNVSTAG